MQVRECHNPEPHMPAYIRWMRCVCVCGSSGELILLHMGLSHVCICARCVQLMVNL